MLSDKLKSRISWYIRRMHGGRTPSKYLPHQGAQECARRRKQKGVGEFRA